MEGLHNAFEEAVGNGLITGVNIKNSTINVSHLFYADDVIITTDWNAKDMDNIIRVLHVFYLAKAGRRLFDRFHMRLSLGGKAIFFCRLGVYDLTLIKSVLGSLEYLTIYRFFRARIRSHSRSPGKEFGGLNIGSLKAFNLALLQNGRGGLLFFPKRLCGSGSSKALSLRQEGGCGTRIRFWKDIWVGETPFLFTRLTNLRGLNSPPHRLKPGKALPFQEVGVATSELFAPNRNRIWNLTPFSVTLASPFTTRAP
ncbi:hypothetical protein Tco_0046760 [Tanacetum coccineum]